MRIATLIISLLVGLFLVIQSFSIFGLSSIAQDEATGAGGAIGLFCALLWLIGAAFVMAFPMVSVVTFAFSALLLFAGGASTPFTDLIAYGVVAIFLTLTSLLGYFGKRKERRERLAELQRQHGRDERLEQMMRQQMQSR